MLERAELGLQPHGTAHMHDQVIDLVGFFPGVVALIPGALNQQLHGMVFILPDGAAHAMVDILGAGPVIVEFGVVEGLLPTGKIEKGGVQLAGELVL